MVGCREGARVVESMGIFPPAEVVRGHDWSWGQQDGEDECMYVYSSISIPVVDGTSTTPSLNVYKMCMYMYMRLVVLNQGPCPVYYSGRGRHYVGNDVVDESH